MTVRTRIKPLQTIMAQPGRHHRSHEEEPGNRGGNENADACRKKTRAPNPAPRSTLRNPGWLPNAVAYRAILGLTNPAVGRPRLVRRRDADLEHLKRVLSSR